MDDHMDLLAEISEAQVAALGLFILGLTIITWLLLRRGRRYYAQQRQAEAARRQSAQAGQSGPVERGHHLDAPAAAVQWEVQMHETARELSARLDSKMSALQALIAEADRAAARLETALGHAAGAAAETPPPDRAAVEHRCEEIYTLADYGLPPQEIAGRLGLPVGEVQSILALRDS